uniref:Uncharacterized protein n=1 Tax=Ditylenchus dipsaci TaxID=166011 RepID=A0A915CT43_9BILA
MHTAILASTSEADRLLGFAISDINAGLPKVGVFFKLNSTVGSEKIFIDAVDRISHAFFFADTVDICRDIRFMDSRNRVRTAIQLYNNKQLKYLYQPRQISI